MSTWSHPVLTSGQPIVVRKLNLRGLRAVVQKQVAMKRAGVEDSPEAKLDLFVVMAHETLRRSLPNVTPEQIEDALEVEELQALSEAIVAANPDLAKRSAAGNPQAS